MDMQADRSVEQHTGTPTTMPPELADHRPTINNESTNCKKGLTGVHSELTKVSWTIVKEKSKGVEVGV